MLSSHYHLWDLANAFASCSVEEQMHLLPCLNSEACPKNKELKNLFDYLDSCQTFTVLMLMYFGFIEFSPSHFKLGTRCNLASLLRHVACESPVCRIAHYPGTM